MCNLEIWKHLSSCPSIEVIGYKIKLAVCHQCWLICYRYSNIHFKCLYVPEAEPLSLIALLCLEIYNWATMWNPCVAALSIYLISMEACLSSLNMKIVKTSVTLSFPNKIALCHVLRKNVAQSQTAQLPLHKSYFQFFSSINLPVQAMA